MGMLHFGKLWRKKKTYYILYLPVSEEKVFFYKLGKLLKITKQVMGDKKKENSRHLSMQHVFKRCNIVLDASKSKIREHLIPIRFGPVSQPRPPRRGGGSAQRGTTPLPPVARAASGAPRQTVPDRPANELSLLRAHR